MTHDLDARAGLRSICGSSGAIALAACAGALLMASVLSAPAAAQDAGKMKPHPDGFWKIHPSNHLKAEFGGEDVIGLANSQHIPTDCSIAWKNGPKFYCFSSQMSSQFVQENPDAYLPRAAAFWAKDHPQQDARSQAAAGALTPH